MTAITHHVSDALLEAYVTGNLSQPFALVVATHISLCIECRATMEAHQALGGAVMEATEHAVVSEGLKLAVFDKLDAPTVTAPHFDRSGIFPGPLMEVLKGKPPRWKTMGGGIKQSILSSDHNGSARLLFIPPNRAVPEHTHNGLELTLVLQGSFSDYAGRFGVGDLEVADDDIDHQPIADPGTPCVCLAATDAPLRFNSLLPRLIQPLFRI